MHGSMVEDFTAVVKGGSSESITALLSRRLPTPQLMGLWGNGVRFNPDFIRSTVSFSSIHYSKSHVLLRFFSHLPCPPLFLFMTDVMNYVLFVTKQK